MKDTTEPGTKLEVRFTPSVLRLMPFVWGDYWIIDLDKEYTYAVVGEPSRKFHWVLSRQPELSDSTYMEVLNRLSKITSYLELLMDVNPEQKMVINNRLKKSLEENEQQRKSLADAISLTTNRFAIKSLVEKLELEAKGLTK